MNAPAQAGLAGISLKDPKLFREQCYIDGRWTDADSGAVVEVTNPATGEVLGTVPKMGAAETRRAIEAAEKAWPAWRKLLAKERANILRQCLHFTKTFLHFNQLFTYCIKTLP